MISGPWFGVRYREDEVTRQQVRPGTVRRVWPYLRRYRGQMVLLVFITAVGSAIVVVSPLILRLIIDDGILRHRESVVVALALTVAGLGLVDAGAEYVKSWYSAWMAESLVLELRASVFRHVLLTIQIPLCRSATHVEESSLSRDSQGQALVVTLTDELQAAQAAAPRDQIVAAAAGWSHDEERDGLADPETLALACFLLELADLARQAGQRGERLYCWL